MVCTSAACPQGSASDTPGPVGGPAANLPDLRLAVPRPVRAATAALGLARQRLALVLGNGRVGALSVLDSAPGDTQAVAAVLRAGGFVVMVREDLSAAALRENLKEFHSRLLPSGIGFIYATGLGLQLDGQNLLLGRDAQLAPRLQAQGVPVRELAEALMGGVASPRWLVLDAAFAHPALATVAPPGLAAQTLPPGVMALFSSAPGVWQKMPAEVPAVAPADAPAVAAAPGTPALAATAFARSLVAALGTPRASGGAALRSVRRVVVDATQGQVNPWLGGDTDEEDEFAEAGMLDALLPRTPEEVAREAVKQGLRLAQRAAVAQSGELSVAEVLQQSANAAPARAATPALAGDEVDPPAKEGSRMQPKSARPGMPEVPPSAGNGLANTLASQAGQSAASSALGTAASVAGTLAGAVASTAANVVVGGQTAQARVALQAASSAANLAGSVAGNVAALATRSSPASAAEEPARTVVQRLAAPTVAGEAAGAAATRVSAANVLQTSPAAASTAAISVLPAAANAARLAQAAGPAAPTATATAATTTTTTTAPPAPAAAARPATTAPATDGRTQRVGERGERPVYQPRTNKHGYAEGDTFSYQLIDTWRGETIDSHTTAIEEVLDDGQLLANGATLQMDAQGRATQTRRADGSSSRFEPSQQLWWSSPQRGESREVLFKEFVQRADNSRAEVEWKGSASVGRLRPIETPAGAFDAVPIESSGWFYETTASGDTRSGKWSRTVWYAPRLGHPVAIDLEDSDRLGKLQRRERLELTHVQSQRHAP